MSNIWAQLRVTGLKNFEKDERNYFNKISLIAVRNNNEVKVLLLTSKCSASTVESTEPFN